MSIRTNILKIKQQLLLETIANEKPTADRMQDLSLRAIDNGKNSDAWREYMATFADPDGDQRQRQLDRLFALDGTEGNIDLNRARAYLVADGSCGTDTVTNFGNGASVLLDVDL